MWHPDSPFSYALGTHCVPYSYPYRSVCIRGYSGVWMSYQMAIICVLHARRSYLFGGDWGEVVMSG
jgi:hypothetical protein